MSNREFPSLGSCCGCGREDSTVRNVVTVELKSPEPGNGCWGCLVCDLPQAGAVAVLCDECITSKIAEDGGLERVCLGFPGENRRIPLSELTERFEHDEAKHEKDDAAMVSDPDPQLMAFAERIAGTIIDHIMKEVRQDVEKLKLVERHQRN